MVDDNDITTIKVKTDPWERLNRLKKPGDSFDDVVSALLDETESGKRSSAESVLAD